MAGPPRRIPSWIEISIHGTQESTQRVSTFGYRWLTGGTAPPNVTTLTNMATAFYTAIQSAWTGITSTNYNFDSVEARWLDPAGPLIAGVYNVTFPHPGTASGQASPANVALSISWRTGQLGRRYRGRTFMPAISGSALVGSLVNGSYITAASALAAIVRDFTNGTGANQVHAAVPSFVGQVMTDITSFVIDSAVDSQRRRLINRGR